jgi:phosphatidylserine/phosphatidylglycerophosphate/cardiolipin synthase-like enzyme
MARRGPNRADMIDMTDVPPADLAPSSPDGHLVTPLVDGVAAFESVYRDLLRARWRIYLATWALEDDFVVHRGRRGDLTLGAFCKRALAEHPGLEIYLLVWDWELYEMPAVAGLSVPGAVGIAPKVPPVPSRSAFCDPATADRLHLALHGNPVAGSHHQKFLLCDLTGGGSPDPAALPGASLHCLGLNMQNSHWDLPCHPFPPAFRKQPYLWHDTGVRVEGPVIAAFEREFGRRWRDATGQDLPLHQFANPPRGPTRVHPIVHQERAVDPSPVKDWYLRAIPTARDLVYLENQYFDDVEVATSLWEAYLAAERRGRPLRAALVLPWWEDVRSTYWPLWHPIAPWLRYNVAHLRVRTAEAFKRRGVDAPYVRPPGGWPEVRLPPDPDRLRELADPASGASGDELAAVPRHFAVRVGAEWVEWTDVEWVKGGVAVYRMMAGTGRWPPRPVYVHSKLGVVDDAYTVGSSNLSCQSFVTDSEANLVVQGADELRDMLDRLWPPLLGPSAPIGAAPAAWLDAFATTAERNQRAADLAARGKRAPPPTGLLLPWQPYDY